MYTYGGDATLDGKINVDDYIRVDSGIASNLSGWFNYDGKVNIDDYTTVIDANIANQSGIFPTSSSDLPAAVTAIPEPTSLMVLIIVGSLPQVRRRRFK